MERSQFEGDLVVGDVPVGELIEIPSVSSTQQKTLKTSIHCNGVGLHSGEKIAMSLYPADVDTGVVFRRTDLRAGQTVVAAHFANVCDTRLCTSLANESGVGVATVEHLMAALAGCEIDNVEIELDGPEVPIMDGSAEPFVFLIECAGIVEQDTPRREQPARDRSSPSRTDPRASGPRSSAESGRSGRLRSALREPRPAKRSGCRGSSPPCSSRARHVDLPVMNWNCRTISPP